MRSSEPLFTPHNDTMINFTKHRSVHPLKDTRGASQKLSSLASVAILDDTRSPTIKVWLEPHNSDHVGGSRRKCLNELMGPWDSVTHVFCPEF